MHLNNEEYTTNNGEDIQITDSSWIDWDDKNRIETFVKRQKELEEQHGFDPSDYFGGMKVHDLEEIEEDPRIEEMFKDEMSEYLVS